MPDDPKLTLSDEQLLERFLRSAGETSLPAGADPADYESSVERLEPDENSMMIRGLLHLLGVQRFVLFHVMPDCECGTPHADIYVDGVAEGDLVMLLSLLHRKLTQAPEGT